MANDVESCHTFAKNLKKVIHLPLEYDVVPDDEVLPSVFDSASTSSRQVGRLQEGAVHGYPAGEWLHIPGEEVARLKAQGMLDGDLREGWVHLSQVANAAEGARVVPRWAQIEVEMIYFEALEFSWSGIAGEFVTYSVQWRQSEPGNEQNTEPEAGRESLDQENAKGAIHQEETAKKFGAIECTSSRALLHGLPQASLLEVRIVAAVTGPEIDFIELEIFGSWTQLRTGSPSPDEDVEALGDRDLLGGYRGGCLLSSCRGFLAAPLQSSHAERCRRCGSSYEDHLELEDQALKEAPAQQAVKAEGSSVIDKEPQEAEDVEEAEETMDGTNADGRSSASESQIEELEPTEDADGLTPMDDIAEDADDRHDTDGDIGHADVEHDWEVFLQAEEGDEPELHASAALETEGQDLPGEEPLSTPDIEEFIVAAATVVRSLPSSSASSLGQLKPGEIVSGSLQDDWLLLREGDKEESRGFDGWVSLEDLENAAENNVERSALLKARQLFGGLTYQVVKPAAIHPTPSRLHGEISSLTPGQGVTGFPASPHWIRLDSTELDFISHWIFQPSAAPSLHADWCDLTIVKKKSGVLKVTWPGLKAHSSISPGFIFYSLEWTFAAGKGGCGLVLVPECTIVLKNYDCKTDKPSFRVCAYINAEDTLEIIGDWHEGTLQTELDFEPNSESGEVLEEIGEERPSSPPPELHPGDTFSQKDQVASQTDNQADDRIPSANDLEDSICTVVSHVESSEQVSHPQLSPGLSSHNTTEPTHTATADQSPKELNGRKQPEEPDERNEPEVQESQNLENFQTETLESKGYEVVYENGALVRSAPRYDASVLRHLSVGEHVSGRAKGAWLQLDSMEIDKELGISGNSERSQWVLIDGKEIGLGILLRQVPVVDDCNTASPEPTQDDQPTLPAVSSERVSAEVSEEKLPGKETKDVTSKEPKVKPAKATKHASILAERVVEPVEYVVLASAPLHAEPKFQSEEIGELQAGCSLFGFPGSLSWVRLARSQQPHEETWAPIKSAKGVFLTPKWSHLESQGVFSEALEVSWQGVTARSPYVAAYSIEWRLTPGEELPIGAGQPGDSEGLKKTGYALSLKPRVLLHGLPPGAAVQLRAGVRVAAQSAGEADFRLLGSWQDFTTGSPIPEEDEREVTRQIDPFGARRAGCESSQCRGYVADLDALASVGANANSLVTKAICLRCGKSFDAHERFDNLSVKPVKTKSAKSSKTERESPAQPVQVPTESRTDQATKTFVVLHPMVFVRDRASVKGRTLGVVKQGEHVQGWPMSGWLRLSAKSAFAGASADQDCWVLIHGAEVGLGQLLEEVEDTRRPQGTEASQDTKHYEESAKESRSVLSEPLVFSVIEQVPVQELPRATSKTVGQLSAGSLLQGFPAHNWIKILSASGSLQFAEKWVENTIKLKQQLLPLWAALDLQQAFEEALQLCWKGLPSVQATRYKLECRLPGGTISAVDIGLGKTSALLGGLPNGATLHVRVKANVYSPSAPDGLKFEGAWVEMQCLRGSKPKILVPACPSASATCDEFKATKDGASEEELCRRCGHSRAEHQAHVTAETPEDRPVHLAATASPQKYEVVVATVYVRKEPSTVAAPVGFVHQGSVLVGEVSDGWLKLSSDTCERFNFTVSQAYIATEGCFAERPDLGALLVPLGDSERIKSLESLEPSRAGEKSAPRNVDSLRLRADRASQVLGKEPLVFQVVSEKACIREEPNNHSALKHSLKKGEAVKGFPSGSWLRLEGSHGWVLIEAAGSDANLYLEAEWSKMTVKQAFLEALILEWPGLRIDQKVTYAVEWRRSGMSGAGGHAVSKSTRIHLTGLPTDGNFAMRVLACVTSDAQGVTPLRLNGPWVEATSLPAEKRPGRARAGSLDVNLDPVGEIRGECQASKCSAYLAPEDSASYVNDPKSTLCRRCGYSFLEHKKGEKNTKTSLRPAQTSKVSSGREAFNSQKGLTTFVVQHRAVLLRSKPSVNADKLGIVCRGHVLQGYEMEGWVQLTRESSMQAGAGGKVAWALINGEEVGLGVLLRPLKPGEKPKATEEDSDEEKGISWRAEDVYTGALEFEVIFKSVSVRRRPKVAAKSLGIVKEGDRVFGYPTDNWLQTSKKYRQKEPGWIRMDGTDMGHGPLVQCTSLKPQMTKCFAEALLITWQQLPAKSALYTLEWMSQDKKTKTVALDKTRSTTGKIQGLAADSTYYVRVMAFIMVPGMEASNPKSVCAKICSDWAEAQTGTPVDAVEQTSMTFDPLARIRGKCSSCKYCECFILSKYSYLMHLDQVLCRRCGCACTSHEIVGEYGKSQAQWAKENAQRRQREDQKRAANKKPTLIPEIPCLPWQPDDSPAGTTKANYVITQVKKARNLYETLGVKPSAAAKDIRNAYRQIALRIHPDKVCPGGQKDSELITAAEAAFKLVSSAYEVLGDEGKRSSYNHTMRLSSKSAASTNGPRTTTPSDGTKRESWPGGSKSSKEVNFKVVHAISAEELRMTMNVGTSVVGLKRALCKRLKRGPPESVDLCDTKGCILEDDHRFASDQVLYCVGISLGAPRTVKLEVRDHRTGARLYLDVLDTVSMESLRKKVARELQVKEKEIQIGQQKFTGKGSTRRFEALPTDELLNGRRTIYVNGNNVLIYLTLEQALQLQRDLIVAYSQPKFQRELDALLSAHPLPESITQMKFREAFGKLVRNAQKECLRRWGFEGDFAAQNMMTAFGKVGHTPEVYSLSIEIDKLLRITSGGMIAAPIKPKKDEQAVPQKRGESQSTQEATKPKLLPRSPVTITVRQAVDEESGAPAPSLKVTVAADATMRKVKQAIAEKLGMKRSTTIKLVFDLHGKAAKLRKTTSMDSGMTFASFKDDEQIGSRRELLVLGADLRQASEIVKPSLTLGDSVVVTIREAESSREARVMVYPSSTMHDVKISVAKRLERWDIFQKGWLAQYVNGKLQRLQDQDVVGPQRTFVMEAVDLVHRNLQDVQSVTPLLNQEAAQKETLSPLPVLLAVVHAIDGDKVMLSLSATSTIAEVLEALAQKLEHKAKILSHGKLVQKVGEQMEPLNATEIVGQRRTLYFMGCELQRLPPAEIPFSVGPRGNATIEVTVRKAADESPGPHEVALQVSANGTMQDVKEELARWLGRPEMKYAKLGTFEGSSGLRRYPDSEKIRNHQILFVVGEGLQAAPWSPAASTSKKLKLPPQEVVLLLLELQQAVKDENFDEVLDEIETCKSKKAANWEEESNELFAKGLTKVWGPTLVRRGFSPGEDGFQAMFGIVSAYGRRFAVRRAAFGLERALRFKPGDFFGLPEEASGASGRSGLEPEQAEELVSGILTLLKSPQFQENLDAISHLPEGNRRQGLGMHFAVACKEFVSEQFGYKAGKEGFGQMFEDVWQNREDPVVAKLAEDCEHLMRVPPGSWFGFIQNDTTVASPINRLGRLVAEQFEVSPAAGFSQEVEIRVELSDLQKLPDGDVIVQVRRTATMREVREAVAWQILTAKAEAVLPTAVEVAEVASIGMIAAAIGDSVAVDLLTDDAQIEDRRRFLWVSGDLAAELLPDDSDDLDYLFPNALIDQDQALRVEEMQNKEEDKEVEQVVAKEEEIEEMEVQEDQELEKDPEIEQIEQAGGKLQETWTEEAEVEDVQSVEDLASMKDVESVEDAEAAKVEDEKDSDGKAALRVEVPKEASDWQVRTLAEFMQLVGVCVVRAGEHAGTGADRILKLGFEEFVEDDFVILPDVSNQSDAFDGPGASQKVKDVVVRSVTSEGLGGQFHISIPEDATVGLLRELVTRRCGGGGVAAHIRMVRRFTDVLFLPMDDCETIQTEEVLLLGIDLSGVEADEEKVAATVSAASVETEEAHADNVKTRDARESMALLIAAMELLEDPQVQELFMGLDTSVSQILTAWEPPWISSGFHDLDAQTLQTVTASTLQGWAESFSQLVIQMTRHGKIQKAPSSMTEVESKDSDKDSLDPNDDPEVLDEVLDEVPGGKHYEDNTGDKGDKVSKEDEKHNQVTAVAEPEMEPEQEPSELDQDMDEDLGFMDEIVMVELQHVTSGQRFAVTVQSCAYIEEVKAALGSTLGLQSVAGLQISNEEGKAIENEQLAGRRRLFFKGPEASAQVATCLISMEDDEVIDA